MAYAAVPAFTVPIGRVVVIEWLAESDDQTGKRLVERIERFRARKPKIQFYQCLAREDFLATLALVARSVESAGVPILHIESHGVQGPHGGLSSNADGVQILTWSELRGPLMELNLASDFNLIVFIAACYGDGILWEIGNEDEPVPAIGYVGFRKKIDPSGLLNATVEFYRALFVDDLDIDRAIDQVREQSTNPQIENLHAESARSLLIGAIRNTLKENWPQSMTDPYLIEACQEVEARLFAYDRFPQNRSRFRIDLPGLIAESFG